MEFIPPSEFIPSSEFIPPSFENFEPKPGFENNGGFYHQV